MSSAKASSSVFNNPVEASPHVHDLLQRLHARSLEQEAQFSISDVPKESFDAFMEDKFVALEEDKCQLVYQLIRASGARNVVEVSAHTSVLDVQQL